MTDSRGGYTYGELVAESERVGLALLDAGVRHGDVVAVQLPNWKEFVATILGAERIGAAVTPLAPALRANELQQICRLAQPKVMVVPQSFRDRTHVETALALRETAGAPETIVVVGGESSPGAESWDDFRLRAAGAPREVLRFIGPAGTDVAELAFTSGTTGEPKGVMHTHNSAVAAVVSTARRQAFGRTTSSTWPPPSGTTRATSTAFGWLSMSEG